MTASIRLPIYSGTALAQRLEKCEISMQDNDEKLGARHPIKPAVMGFSADKMTCRMQTFECSLLRPLEYICIFNFVARNFPQGVISSQSRYDRFDTSAYLVFTAPPRTAFGKKRDFDAR